MVPEPSIDECIQILHGLKPKYEEHHKLKYTDDALEVPSPGASRPWLAGPTLPVDPQGRGMGLR